MQALLIGSEQLGLTGSTTTAGSGGVQKNVAGDVSIVTSASGITLQDDGGSGGLASNYTLVGGTHQVDITQAPVTIDLTDNMMEQQTLRQIQLTQILQKPSMDLWDQKH